MSLKVANTIVITDDLRGRFANTTFTGGAYLVMPEDPSVERRNQGTISGYVSGGLITPPPNRSETIDKFAFATDGNATDVGNLILRRTNLSGTSSQSHGYSSGGYTDTPTDGRSNVIDKFSFAVDANATDVGDLTIAVADTSGQSSQTHGYVMGGRLPPGGTTEDIERFPFASDNNATDLSNSQQSKHNTCGLESLTRGFIVGGINPGGYITRIEAFPFSADTDAGKTGDLATGIGRCQSGQQTESHGYISGGQIDSNTGTTDIQKFSFVSDSNASDVGDLTQARRGNSGSSSTVSGYSSGGMIPAPPFGSDFVNTIDKFPFASDGTATDVGDITQSREQVAGHQR